MDIIQFGQFFTVRTRRVELHQMGDFSPDARRRVLCQDLIAWTGRRKVATAMLGARRHLLNMDIST
jgi:hypothetical protein